LPKDEATGKRSRFKTYEIGYVHIDSCELRHADGKLIMFLAIDRVSKFTYVEFRDRAGKMDGSDFLRNVVAAFPYKIHTVLTDNGMAFADLPKYRHGDSRHALGAHIFDRVWKEHGIEHRLTKPYHPWTNGQAVVWSLLKRYFRGGGSDASLMICARRIAMSAALKLSNGIPAGDQPAAASSSSSIADTRINRSSSVIPTMRPARIALMPSTMCAWSTCAATSISASSCAAIRWSISSITLAFAWLSEKSKNSSFK
jgi:hypothetical protein